MPGPERRKRASRRVCRAICASPQRAVAGPGRGSGSASDPDRMNVPNGPPGASARDVRSIGAARETSVAAVRGEGSDQTRLNTSPPASRCHRGAPHRPGLRAPLPAPATVAPPPTHAAAGLAAARRTVSEATLRHRLYSSESCLSETRRRVSPRLPRPSAPRPPFDSPLQAPRSIQSSVGAGSTAVSIHRGRPCRSSYSPVRPGAATYPAGRGSLTEKAAPSGSASVASLKPERS